MDGAADLRAEHLVDEAVLLDAAAPLEGRGAVTVARKWSPPPV